MPRPLSEALMWGAMVDPRTIVTKAGEFMNLIRYVPRDMASSTPAQSVAVRSAVNTMLKRFGSRWGLWFIDRCRELREYDSPHEFPDPVSAAIDEHRRRLFTATGQQFESTYAVAALYAPIPDAIGRLAYSMEAAPKGLALEERMYRAEVDTFRSTVAAFKLDLAHIMPTVDVLEGDHLFSFLHSLISIDHRQLQMPDLPLFLSEALTDDVYVSGMYPKLGDHHVRTICIKDQPQSFSPGMLADLSSVEFPYTHVARWLPLDRADADVELTTRRDSWEAARKTILQRTMESFGRQTPPEKINLSAQQNMEGANAALALLANGECTFGRWTHTVTMMHPDIDVLHDRCRTVQKIFGSFITRLARDEAMPEWLGSLPGHPRAGLDRFLGPSISFAEIIPSGAEWCGPERDDILDGPPLLRCMSAGKKPFRLCLHQEGSDVGHVLVLGESGGGKSTLLKSIVVGHRKYRGSRVFYIDRGAVAKLTTLALGGEFHSLDASDAAVSLQPLAFIDDPLELAWANEFILGCLRQQRLEATSGQQREITSALRALTSRPQNKRTLTMLMHAVQDVAVKDALSVFCHGGACGNLLDNAQHRVGAGAGLQCFETDALLQNTTALAPVLACIFHEISRSYTDDRPTLVVIDEAKTAITNPLIAPQVDELIRRARREKIQVVLATHSVEDIEASPIGGIISNSVKSTVFTANASAIEPRTAEALGRHGWSPTQVQIIAGLTPKREYVFASTAGWRRFELCLSEYEKLFLCGGSGSEALAIDRVMAAGPREEFVDRWMAFKEAHDKWTKAA